MERVLETSIMNEFLEVKNLSRLADSIDQQHKNFVLSGINVYCAVLDLTTRPRI